MFLKELTMRTLIFAAAAATFALGACAEAPNEEQSDMMEDQADAVDDMAEDMPTEAGEDMMEDKADAIDEAADEVDTIG
ncbi:hypothetical protein NAP1_08362 [Erythrobacter sp. NAP1]|nr:hypothetical protein NAP1_08362 [Erythrobacter sp. NAP1]